MSRAGIFCKSRAFSPVGADTAYLGKLKNRKVLSAVWMPTHPPEFTGECYADLEQIQAIHKTYFRRIRPEQHFRLSAQRTRLLQQSRRVTSVGPTHTIPTRTRPQLRLLPVRRIMLLHARQCDLHTASRGGVFP